VAKLIDKVDFQSSLFGSGAAESCDNRFGGNVVALPFFGLSWID
jgi:hypothetical protein